MTCSCTCDHKVDVTGCCAAVIVAERQARAWVSYQETIVLSLVQSVFKGGLYFGSQQSSGSASAAGIGVKESAVGRGILCLEKHL